MVEAVQYEFCDFGVIALGVLVVVNGAASEAFV